MIFSTCCGLPMVEAKRRVSHYSPSDGTPVFIVTERCPKWRWWWQFSHRTEWRLSLDKEVESDGRP